MTNVLLIANCQVQPLEFLFRLNPDIDNLLVLPVHLKGSDYYNKKILEIETFEKDLLVIQFNGLFEKLELSENVKEKVYKIVTFTNIYFDGVHPDLANIGSMGQRIQSPLGDYHSKIVMTCYQNDFSLNHCLSLFNEKIYQKLGYMAAWENSELELKKRDIGIDVKFSDLFINLTREQPKLFTFNHPTSIVFLHLANLIFSFLNLQLIKLNLNFHPNFLASNAYWPIYPELSSYHNLPYHASMQFKAPDNHRSKLLNLSQFINESYILYERLLIKQLAKPNFVDKIQEYI